MYDLQESYNALQHFPLPLCVTVTKLELYSHQYEFNISNGFKLGLGPGLELGLGLELELGLELGLE